MAYLDFLREMQAGRLPRAPIGDTVDFTLDEVEPGRAVFSLTPGEEHYNPIGSVHGGIFATLLDSAAGCAVQSTLPQGTAYTSLDLTVKFLRPITVDTGPVRAIGTVVNRGAKRPLPRRSCSTRRTDCSPTPPAAACSSRCPTVGCDSAGRALGPWGAVGTQGVHGAPPQ